MLAQPRVVHSPCTSGDFKAEKRGAHRGRVLPCHVTGGALRAGASTGKLRGGLD